jgi:hypothetical protein
MSSDLCLQEAARNTDYDTSILGVSNLVILCLRQFAESWDLFAPIPAPHLCGMTDVAQPVALESTYDPGLRNLSGDVSEWNLRRFHAAETQS